MSREVQSALQDAVKDLLYMSESDEPFQLIELKGTGENLDTGAVRKLAACDEKTPVVEVTIEEFFAELVKEQDWHAEEEKAEARRYQNLLRVIKNHLRGVKVYRVGEIQVDILLIGKANDGDWTGIRTKAVET